MTSTARTLGEICDEVGGIIRTGPFGSQLHESDYREEGTPVIMPKDIVEGKVSADSIARVGYEDVTRLSQHVLKRGEIVYGRRGDIGRRALITEKEAGWLCGTGCLRVSLGETVLDPQFLFYYLGQPRVIEAIAKQAVGATLPNLNTSIIRSIPITYPSLPIQRRIASILSAYDDLIENNTRRIKILEQMAQAIYREWFVEFRAPGVKLRKATPEEQKVTGKDRFPAGWEIAKIGDVASVNPSSIKRGQEPEVINYVDIASVSTGQIDKIQEVAFVDAPGRARRIVQDGDIIWSCVRPNRKSYSLIINPLPNLIVSTGFAVLRSRDIPFTFLYQAVTTDEFVGYLTNHATGAAYPAVVSGDFENAVIIRPPKEVLDSFHQLTSDAFYLRQNLQVKNANLRQTRDLLLPRLVGGEIRIEPSADGGTD
jgi:type I restriction enzyme S subunit